MPELTDIRYKLPEIERAVVLAPHPDDETLGCGGTISVYSSKIDFTVVALSNGEAVNIPEDNKGDRRQKELVEAMKILGVRDTMFLNIPDGKFHENRQQIEEKLSEIFLLKKPQLVFSPSPFDSHPDHRETAMAGIESVKKCSFSEIVFYEIYNPIRFNTLIDISKSLETKREALKKYHYSMLKKEDVFIASNLGLNRFRSLFTLAGSYYEAFWIPDEVPGLSEITAWFTYGTASPLPEDSLLNTIKITDSLMFQLREFEKEMEEKETVIRDLKSEVSEQKETISELKEQIRLIEESFFWKLAGRFHRARDVLLPQGTGLRRLYERILSLLKGRSD